MLRITSVLLSLCLLSACDSPVPEQIPGDPGSETPVAPRDEPLTDKPEAEAEAEERGAAPAEAAPSAGRPSSPVRQPPKPQVEPPLILDLSIPDELLALPEDADGLELAPLLPPLFMEKEAAIEPFQLSGRLISNEQGDDYWDSIEGAELQFEFRQ